jgi:hypothetical protein
MANPKSSLWSGRARSSRRLLAASAALAAGCALSLPFVGTPAATVPAWAQGASPGSAVAGGTLGSGRAGGALRNATRASAGGFPAGRAGSQASWLLQAMSHLPLPEASVRSHFDIQFLSQEPPAALNAALGRIGPVTLEAVVTKLPVGLSAIVQTTRGTELTMDLLVDSHGLIRALVFEPYTKPVTTWAAVDADVRSVAPKVALLVASVHGRSCQPVHSLSATTPMPIGSTFKLYVLDALAQDIAAGKLNWIKPVTVTGAEKSLPAGQLQNYRNGTHLPVEAVASDMISLSDNTAADMLMALLGRSAVEQAVKSSGAANASLDTPFLTTRELFTLKLYKWPQLAQRYLALPPAKRLGFLTGTVDKVPLSALRPGLSTWSAPRDVSSIEWFASPMDVCRLYAQLASLAGQPKLGPLSAILTANNGGLALNTAEWRSVWFKGGSEPGVLTLNYMATTKSGHSYVVSVLAENPSHSIGPTATGTLLGAITGAFQLAAR